MYTIYSQAGYKCPWCDKALDLLLEKGLPFSIRPLDRDALLVVAKGADMTTVPIIYQDERLVGGYQELEAEVAKTI